MKQKVWLIWVLQFFGIVILGGYLNLQAGANIEAKKSELREIVSKKVQYGLSEIPGFLNKVPIPAPIKSFFEKFRVEGSQLFFEDSDIEGALGAFGVKGFVKLDNVRVPIKLIFVEMEGDITEIILIVDLPINWKFARLGSQLATLDKGIQLTNPKLILSSFEYEDPAFHNFYIVKGVNVISAIKFVGALLPVQNLVNNLDKVAKPTSKGDIYMVGHIPKPLSKATFTAFLPHEVAFDLKNSKPIKMIDLKSFFIEITASLEANMGLTMLMYSTKLKDPLDLKTFVTIKPNEAVFSGALNAMFDPAFGIKWLALGDFGLSVDLNYAVLASTGLPSGFGVRGKMNIGSGAQTKKIAVAGKVGVGRDNLMLSGKAEELPLFLAVEILNKMIGQKIPVVKKIPNPTLRSIELTVVPQATEISGKKYEQGVKIKADIQLFKVGGGIDITISENNQRFIGKGYLKNIVTPWFKLTGPGLDRKQGTEDDGPVIDIDIGRESQRFFSSGRFEIPSIKLVRDVELELLPHGATFRFEDRIFGKYMSIINGRINLDNPLDFYAKIEMQQDFKKMVQQGLVERFQVMREEAKKKIAGIDAQINQAKQSVKSGAQAEVKKTEEKIKRLKSDIDDLKDNCDDAKWYRKADVCAKVGGQITAKGTEIASLESYKEGLVKPGSQAVTGAMAASQKVAELTKLKQVAQKTVDVTTKTLEYGGRGLAAALSIKSVYAELGQEKPTTDMVMRLNLVINVQGKDHAIGFDFDFGNPRAAMLKLAIQLLELLPE